MLNLFDLSGAQLGTPVNTTAGTGVQALLERITSLLFALAFPLAFIGLVATAWKLISSAGDPAAYASARKNIGYIIVGIVILTLGFYVIKLIYTLFSQSA